MISLYLNVFHWYEISAFRSNCSPFLYIILCMLSYIIYPKIYFSYTKIYIVSRSMYKEQHQHHVIQSGPNAPVGSLHTNIRRELKAVKFLLIMLFLFHITWILSIIVYILRIRLKSRFLLCELEIATNFLLHSCTYTNPLLYGFLSREFNKELRALWKYDTPAFGAPGRQRRPFNVPNHITQDHTKRLNENCIVRLSAIQL